MKNKVYLAGGMKSGWQEIIKKEIDLIYYDPRDKENNYEMSLIEYGKHDLHYIKKCDIVFAYMERTNPSGFGMSAEIGYAKGLGKTIILCLEKNNKYNKDRAISFMEVLSDIVFNDFEEAIKYLRNYE